MKNILTASNKKKPKNRAEYIAMRKKKMRRIIQGVFLLFLMVGGLVWYGLQPLKSTVEYGICRTYVERTVQYPSTIRIMTFDIFGEAVRIFYTHRDGSGSVRSEVIECQISPDPQTGYRIAAMKKNRQLINPADLQDFNETIPAILAGGLDLTVPFPPKDNSIYALKRD